MPPRLLDEAEKLFARQEYRDTYGLIAHVARVYRSYETGKTRKTQNILVLHKTGGSGRHEKNHAKNCEKNAKSSMQRQEETKKRGSFGSGRFGHNLAVFIR